MDKMGAVIMIRTLMLLFAFESVASQSQGHQDGVLQSIFSVIGATNKYYVELGFNSFEHGGGSGSNTYSLKERDPEWRGLLLDGSFENKDINLHKEFITSLNIVSLFKKYEVPHELDYLSIDLDSTDLWILKSILSTYRPRVFSIEYNSNYGDGDRSSLAMIDPSWMPVVGDVDHILPSVYNEGGTRCYFGSSASAINIVASVEHAYKLVSVVHGLDMIYVRNDNWPFDAMNIDNVNRRFVHVPMTVQEGSQIMDYKVWQQGGTLCEARQAAALRLRELSKLDHESNLHKNCTLKGSVRLATPQCNCYENLLNLPIPTCPQIKHKISEKLINDKEKFYSSQITFEGRYLETDIHAPMFLNEIISENLDWFKTPDEKNEEFIFEDF